MGITEVAGMIFGAAVVILTHRHVPDWWNGLKRGVEWFIDVTKHGIDRVLPGPRMLERRRSIEQKALHRAASIDGGYGNPLDYCLCWECAEQRPAGPDVVTDHDREWSTYEPPLIPDRVADGAPESIESLRARLKDVLGKMSGMVDGWAITGPHATLSRAQHDDYRAFVDEATAIRAAIDRIEEMESARQRFERSSRWPIVLPPSVTYSRLPDCSWCGAPQQRRAPMHCPAPSGHPKPIEMTDGDYTYRQSDDVPDAVPLASVDHVHEWEQIRSWDGQVLRQHCVTQPRCYIERVPDGAPAEPEPVPTPAPSVRRPWDGEKVAALLAMYGTPETLGEAATPEGETASVDAG